MPRKIEGRLTVSGQRFAIVVSRFNEVITTKLLAGALDALRRHGCGDDQITCIHVPGAFEIPFIARKLAEASQYDAIICIGCVIRGETPHFEYVAGEAARGVADVGLSTGVPTTFGIITTDTVEQAIARSGPSGSNKGEEAALGAIELVNLLALLPKRA